jgi:dTDP-4-amino-4,6-dideoxygalactose transaminase
MSKESIRIPYVNLPSQWEDEREELLPIIDGILGSGQYVGGDEIVKFEKEIAKRCDVDYAIALNSGTDALTLSLHIMGIGRGDEVITPPNSFIASTAAILHLGAKPVFIDVQDDQNIDPKNIEAAITEKTKAIMPVHLTGRVCNMDPIMEIAKKYSLFVIEDSAQAVGSKYKERPSGSIGHVGCFSTHPLKNLNACGDGGFITTNDKNIFFKAKALSNHGMVDRDKIESFGYVSRMDNLQAGILNYRLKKLDKIICLRRKNAQFYIENIQNKNIFFPLEKEHEFNTYHTFVIQTKKRDLLRSHLLNAGINTAIHYPIPIHLQPAANKLGWKKGSFPITEKQSSEILTLPVNQFLKLDDIKIITKVVNAWEAH